VGSAPWRREEYDQDVGGVEVERHPVPAPDPQKLEGPTVHGSQGDVQRSDVPQGEPAQERPGGLRSGNGEAAKFLLDQVASGHGEVVEAVRAEGDGLGHAGDELPLGESPGPFLHVQVRPDRAGKTDGLGRLTDEDRSGLSGDRAVCRGDVDPGLLSGYAHLEDASCAGAMLGLDACIIPGQEAFSWDVSPRNPCLPVVLSS